MSGGKKYSRKRFKELVYSLAKSDVSQQEQLIEKAFLDWKSEVDQIDDVLVAGVTF